jgi:hypothetical protein
MKSSLFTVAADSQRDKYIKVSVRLIILLYCCDAGTARPLSEI